jgi:hypothetical protein
VGVAEPLGQAGSAISMYVSLPAGGTGKLTIDPDRVELFINYMEQALAKLKEAEVLGQQLMDVDPPGDDPFSPTAVEAIKRTAGKGPGGHLYANRRAQDAFQAIIDNTRASLAAYREQEARAAETFRGDT